MIRAPLLFLSGAPGAGKTTVADLVARRCSDFTVLDMDLLLEPAGALSGRDLRRADAQHLWPAYNELWLRLAGELANIRPVLLLGPLVPDDIEGIPARQRFTTIAWAVLDCMDETRRQRLVARGYDAGAIDAALADARAIRALGLRTIKSDRPTPDEVADDVAAWANAV